MLASGDINEKNSVVVIPTRVANIASMMASLKRAGANPILNGTPEVINDASHVVLPGVGTFQSGMQELLELDIASTIIKRISERKSTLCVCVGMQLLFSSSEESPGVKGLNIFPGKFKRFCHSVRVPQFGWNKVIVDNTNKDSNKDTVPLLTSGYAYFANSYRTTTPPKGALVASAIYGEEFVAGFQVGKLLACQFHPELSGTWGQELIRKWLAS